MLNRRALSLGPGARLKIATPTKLKCRNFKNGASPSWLEESKLA